MSVEAGKVEVSARERRVKFEVSAEDEAKLDWYLSSAFAEGA
ncbi:MULTISPECIES: hypothetical protein [Acidilobus]|uniref:Uncharacterized protein n=1 Tax=Acidilobus saccharovorans (strain DSM 16705 / JCM 18335 / VKM B-2471 / 345-15) TaxID=666510 RepID=D9PZL0_ACIS3|nr:hypothetical protein [Acidilobus saccharovorans]ADL18498.1 hypothetical protein ASAC_0090 [Acidilobus saccharovorans 345-15]